MPSFARLFALAVLATVSSATTIVQRDSNAVHGRCSNAKLKHNATIDIGDGRSITWTSHHCSNTPQRRGLLDSWPLCILFNTCKPPPPPPPPPPKNVCGELCTTTCNNDAGSLPPISDDCQTIEDAIQIFQQQTTTFVTDSNNLETLTYNTCAYFFENTYTSSLEYCWADLSTTASRAGDACFPPVQPFFSEGLCTSTDSWAVGAAHS